MTILEALKIVSDNAHGVKHDYWDEYLPAILLVNEAFPHPGNTVDDEWGDSRWSYGNFCLEQAEARKAKR